MISTIILTGDMALSNGNNYLSDNYLLAQKPIRAKELIQVISQLLGNPIP
jgi:hypothetical protein